MKCESHDEGFTGKVDMTIFKTVLLECELGLTLSEISRFVRFVHKDAAGMVDYQKAIRGIIGAEGQLDVIPRRQLADDEKRTLGLAR
jgi:hypothetical protein